MYDWGNLVGEVPNKVIRYHLAIQKEVESKKPEIKEMMEEFDDERAKMFGWESFSQKEYFSNIDKYEDFTFTSND